MKTQPELNLSTPYKIQNSDGIPSFKSKNETFYHLLVFESTHFNGIPELENREYEFGFTANEEFKVVLKNEIDSSVGITIIGYVKAVLDKHPNHIITYSCSDGDGKRHKRIKVFDGWFNKYMGSEEYHLETFITLGKHYSVLLSRKNKDFNLFIETIHSWLKP